MKSFVYDEFLPRDVFDKIWQIRVMSPETIQIEASQRQSKPKLTVDGTLVLVASDYSGRMITEYDGNPVGLANRHEFLARLTRILSCPNIDGVEGTPDILEDLFILNHFAKQKGVDFLKNKLMIGTVNRGGLKGTAWEMDDANTCFTIDKISRLNLDGVKCMFRIDEKDVKSGKTIKYCADVITEADAKGLPVFVEALYVERRDTGFSLKLDTTSLVKVTGVASALGSSSAQKWLEVPINDEYATVAGASTCPLLVVPMETERELYGIVEEYKRGKDSAANVRGVLLGRNVLFAKEDPLLLADAIANVWRKGLDPARALEAAQVDDGKSLFK